ncbi:UNVERIFIED_CONTAM: IS30 family transposase [Paenibacillus sp. PvR008]
MLRHKGKRQQPTEQRGKFTVGKSIRERAKEVRSRETFEHWELDTMVSGRGKKQRGLPSLNGKRTCTPLFKCQIALLCPWRLPLV